MKHILEGFYVFDALDKIKRNTIISTILFIAFGVVILIVPARYIPALVLAVGYVMVIIALVMMLEFISCEKSLMDNIKFVKNVVLAVILMVFSIALAIYAIRQMTKKKKK